MKLSTKGRYGVRLMLDLATHYGKGPVTLKDVSKRQGISEKYLWHLIPPLKNAGLITSSRGAHGGYVLSKSPKDINLREIVSCLEGQMCLSECTGNPVLCKRSDMCVVREIWAEATAKMLETLASFTLERMMERQRIKTGQGNYSI
jgi:Rrf2 family transcriptional regulator, cysteine metabolism repressor